MFMVRRFKAAKESGTTLVRCYGSAGNSFTVVIEIVTRGDGVNTDVSYYSKAGVNGLLTHTSSSPQLVINGYKFPRDEYSR